MLAMGNLSHTYDCHTNEDAGGLEAKVDAGDRNMGWMRSPRQKEKITQAGSKALPIVYSPVNRLWPEFVFWELRRNS